MRGAVRYQWGMIGQNRQECEDGFLEYAGHAASRGDHAAWTIDKIEPFLGVTDKCADVDLFGRLAETDAAAAAAETIDIA